MKLLLELIDNMQKDVFSYHLVGLAGKMLKLSEGLALESGNLTVPERTKLNTILHTLLESYSKKDYLLVADVLEYELKPLLAVRGKSQ